jgi:hypothetical protein
MDDYTKLSEALMGNTNAAGKHMMKISNQGLDATKAGLNDLSNMAKDMANKSVPMFAAGKQKAAEMTDHAVAAAGHGMRQAAQMASDKAHDLQSKLGASSSSIMEHVKSKASEIHSKATPVLHHASGELTKMSQKVASKVNDAKVQGMALASSTGSVISRGIDTVTGQAAKKDAASQSAREANRNNGTVKLSPQEAIRRSELMRQKDMPGKKGSQADFRKGELKTQNGAESKAFKDLAARADAARIKRGKL